MKRLTGAIFLCASTASAGCYQSDVREFCCPLACDAKAKVDVWFANRLLSACMKTIGCRRKNPTVGMVCVCR